MRRLRRAEDRGMSLVEVVVAMSVMSLIMAMFMTTIVQMFRVANKTEAIAGAQSQIGIAFQRLDTEIRYAAGISVPSTSEPWYVEYVIAYTGTAECVQLWLDVAGKQLKRRTWNMNDEPGENNVPGVFAPLAGTGLGGQSLDRVVRTVAPDGTAVVPFIREEPVVTPGPGTPAVNVQRLRVTLSVVSGSDTTESTQDFDVTFTAMNTSRTTSSSTACPEGRL